MTEHERPTTTDGERLVTVCAAWPKTDPHSPIRDERTGRAWPNAERLYLETIAHVVRRIQTDPDVRYLFGSGTESFDMLALCVSSSTGKSLSDARKLVNADCQPEHRRREPEVVELRNKLHACRVKLEELGELDHP